LTIYDFLNLISIALSNVTFILATFIILLVAACFLGHYVVITKKMIIATCGTILFTILVHVAVAIVMYKMDPALMTANELSELSEDTIKAINTLSSISSSVLNIGVFIYAFIIYLFAFKEKRIRRSLESIIILWLYYGYLNNMVLNTIIYIMGGDYMKYTSFLVGGIQEGDYKFNTALLTIYIGICFVLTVFVILLLYFGYYKKERFYVLSIKSRIFFVVWLCSFYVVPSIPFCEDLSESHELLCRVFGVIIPILGFIAPSLLVLTAAEKSLKEKNEYQETYLTAELEYIEQYKRSQTETRAFRHDIINNLSLTSMMLEEGRIEEAGDHLKSLLGNVRSLSPTYITGDEMLDCIVAMKADKMKEMEISFALDGVIDGGLNLKPMDVCSIFANALDNAIEASSKSQTEDSSDSAWIKMDIKRTEKFFVIKIANSAAKQVDVEKLFMSAGYTSKKDKEHHGFGLRNIRKAVEDYDGLVKAESDESSFALSIMIPRK